MVAATVTAVCHGDDVGSTIQRLVEVANVARDVLVSGDSKRDDRYEAKCEEGTAFEDMARHVTTMMALTNDALVTVKLTPESLFSAREEEEHCGRMEESLLEQSCEQEAAGVGRTFGSRGGLVLGRHQ